MSTLDRAREKIRRWRFDPREFAADNFGFVPDEWQADTFPLLGGEDDPKRRVCLKACTGPGKSAVLAIAGWHRLACFAARGEHPKGAALSITADNLKDNLWSELAKWQGRSQFLSEAFTWTKEKIYANDHPETWFLSARSFAKDANHEAIGRALSGLHGQFPFILLDETGDMPIQVGRAANQIFTGNPRDALILQAGNPTSNNGLLFESCKSGLYKVVTITADPDDPKRTPRVSIEHAREMIATYGRDNPWVMATILGLFPPTGFNALLGYEDIQAAVKRQPTDDHWKALGRILGVDVARYGQDASMIAPRAGQVMMPLEERRNVNSIQGAGWVAQRFNEFFGDKSGRKADAIFVDDTGGYGAGWIDQLTALRYSPRGVAFAGAADDPRYFNKRTEMHFRLAEWVKTVGCLPDDPLLHAELLAHTYTFRGDKMWVEEKELVRAKLGRSPDRADAAALTFAYPVAPPSRVHEAFGMPADFRSALSHAMQESYGGGTAGDVYNPMG